jgi:hypothetical protein
MHVGSVGGKAVGHDGETRGGPDLDCRLVEIGERRPGDRPAFEEREVRGKGAPSLVQAA